MSRTQPNDQKALAIFHSKLKIEWAKNHIRGVEQLVESVTSQGGYAIRPYQDPQTGTYLLYIGPKDGGLPASLPLHLGDAIHSLNGVMDYLWSGLARAVDSELASKVTFPRHEMRESLVHALANPRGNHALIKKTFPQVDAFILDVVKPYKRPDGGIWSLNKLDNISKHRLLIPITHIIEFRRDLIARAQDGGTIIHRAGVRIQTHGPSLAMGFRTPFEFNDDAEPILDVVFDPNDPFGGEPVVKTLRNLTEAVAEVIKAFEETFL